MKVSEILDKAIRGEIRWLDVAAILGTSDRHVRRLRARYEDEGAAGLLDGRQGKSPSNKKSFAIAGRVLELYRSRYQGFNVQHFHEQLKEEHQIEVSYSWAKKLLHDAGYVARNKKRGKYRRRQERKAMLGMMLHLDGSKHRWFESEDGAMQDMLVLLDDATGEIIEAELVPEESTLTSLAIIKNAVAERGTFGALYTDRASHFVCTLKAGEGPDRTRKTQVARVLDELGIELICAFSPQARGRSERLWRTLQGRLPIELQKAGIKTYADANAYLRSKFVGRFNRKFRVAPAIEESAFVPVQGFDIERIFALRFERTVAQDNTVRFQNKVFQLPKVGTNSTLARRKVELRLALDGRVSIYLGARTLATFVTDFDPSDPALDVAPEEAA